MGDDELGPWEHGVGSLGITNAKVVWLENNTVSGYGSYPNPGFSMQYWFWDGGPAFPAQNFVLTRVTDPPPLYDPGALGVKNDSFGAPNRNPTQITVGSGDSYYRIVCKLDGVTSPGTFHLWAEKDPGTGAVSLHWFAQNLPAGQVFLWPQGATGVATAEFTSLGSGTYTLAAGTSVIVEAQL